MSRHGIKTAFVFPGGTIAPVIDLLDGAGIVTMCTRHEQGAGYAALAAARIFGTTQVVVVSSGPGVTNVVTAVADAYFDAAPMIVFTGQVGTGDMRGDRPVRQRGFQEVDTVALMAPITKAQFQPRTPADVREVMERAFRIASEGRPGPVLVDLPMDVQRGKVPEGSSGMGADAVPTDDPYPSEAAFDEAVSWLTKAERPLILAGHGAIADGAHKSLRQIAEGGAIPVTMSLLGLGAMPTTHRLALGFHGHTGNQVAGLAIQEADVLLVVGSRLDLRQTGSRIDQFAPKARIIRIEIDPGELSHPRIESHCVLHGRAAPVLAHLAESLSNVTHPDRAPWMRTIDAWRKVHRLDFVEGDPLKPQAVVRAVNRATAGRDLICVSGVGSHQQWVARHFDFDFPRRRWLTSGGHGAMGYDLPVALGAQHSAPGALVVCLVGDGSIQMNIQELATIVAFELPVKIVVIDNHRLAIVSQFQKLNWGRDPTCGDKWNPDFAAIGRAYGLWAETARSVADLDGAVARLLQQRGPALLHCEVDPKEDLSPMLLAGQTLDKMWARE
jgi:acetolactate synthase-1/2/3 large subunit